jgi:type VI secretion system protein ImpK
LEEVLYRSRIAGDRIFQAVEVLANRRTPDPDGVAMTILLAFEMGFRGRYHGGDDHGEIERLKQRLYELVFRTRYAASDDFGTLTVGAAEPLTGRAQVRLPRMRPWGLAIGGVAVSYLLISWLIWWAQVSGTVDNANRVAASLHGLR